MISPLVLRLGLAIALLAARPAVAGDAGTGSDEAAAKVERYQRSGARLMTPMNKDAVSGTSIDESGTARAAGAAPGTQAGAPAHLQGQANAAALSVEQAARLSQQKAIGSLRGLIDARTALCAGPDC